MVTCARCGREFDPADRPSCSAVPGRRCTVVDAAKVQVRGLRRPADPADAGATPGDTRDTLETHPDTLEHTPGQEPLEDPEDDRGAATELEELAAAGNQAETAPTQPAPSATQPDPADPASADDVETPPAGAPAGQELEPAAGGRSTTGSAACYKHDWPSIKRRYVEGVKTDAGVEWPSLDAVAAHFGVGANRVREKSGQEGWVRQRAQWQARVEQARQAARAAALVQSGIDLDNRALSAAKDGLALCLAQLQITGQRLQAERTAAGPGGNVKGIDALEQQRLAQAVDLWHRVGLRSIGDPEAMRLEVTGPGGAPIEISSELRRDDAQRLAGVLSVLEGLGLEIGVAAQERALEARLGEDGTYSTDADRG